MSIPDRSKTATLATLAALTAFTTNAADVAPANSSNEQSTSSSSSLEEIVVTVRRIKERLQDVPTAVTALSTQDINDLRVNGFRQLNGLAPTVNIQKAAGTAARLQFSIRGVSSGNLDLQSDAGIGLYIDGVYIARPSASGFDIADIAHIEISRGPQGTLFGRNATGGAINIITALPTGQFDMHAEADFGNFHYRKQKLSVDLPEWNGFAARVTLGHLQHDGYVNNSARPISYLFSAPFGSYTTSTQYGDANEDTAMVSLDYRGIDRLDVDYKFDYTNWTGTTDGRQLLSGDPSPGGFNSAANLANQPAIGGTNVVSLSRLSAIPSNFDSPSNVLIYGHSFIASYHLIDSLQIKNIAAYRAETQHWGLINIDGNAFVDPSCTATPCAPYTTLSGLRNENQHQYSDELQLIGKSGPVDWIGGLFYFDERGGLNNPVPIGTISGPWSITSLITLSIADYIAGQQVNINNRSDAVYAHATWPIVDSFDVAGGLRYTQDVRYEQVIQGFSVYLYDLPSFTGGTAGSAGGFAPGSTFKYSGNHTDYDLEGTYKFSPDMNVYAKMASGYISGGVTSGLTFKPETITSYELGFKSVLLDRTLRFNAALFYQRRNHLQELGFTAPPGTFIFDGGKEVDSGVELETAYTPVAGTTLGASYGFTNVRNYAGVRTFQPKHTAAVNGQYDFPTLRTGMVPVFRIDATYRSTQTRLPCEAGVAEKAPSSGLRGCEVAPTDTPDPTLDKELLLKAEVALSARLSLTEIHFQSKAVGRVSVWAQNLLDNKNYEFLFPVSGLQTVGIFDTPRTFGVDFSVDF